MGGEEDMATTEDAETGTAMRMATRGIRTEVEGTRSRGVGSRTEGATARMALRIEEVSRPTAGGGTTGSEADRFEECSRLDWVCSLRASL